MIAGLEEVDRGPDPDRRPGTSRGSGRATADIAMVFPELRSLSPDVGGGETSVFRAQAAPCVEGGAQSPGVDSGGGHPRSEGVAEAAAPHSSREARPSASGDGGGRLVAGSRRRSSWTKPLSKPRRKAPRRDEGRSSPGCNDRLGCDDRLRQRTIRVEADDAGPAGRRHARRRPAASATRLRKLFHRPGETSSWRPFMGLAGD